MAVTSSARYTLRTDRELRKFHYRTLRRFVFRPIKRVFDIKLLAGEGTDTAVQHTGHVIRVRVIPFVRTVRTIDFGKLAAVQPRAGLP